MQWYNRVAAVIIPSIWWEPFGIVAVESMACATPVIASRVGGLSKIIDHGQNGILVEPGDQNDLAKAMEWVIDNTAECKIIGERARNKVVNEYHWDIVANKLASIIGLSYR